MLTQLDDMTLVRYGTRYRTRYLLEQARYTLKLAGGEKPPLDLPGDYLSRIERVVAQVEASRNDREVAALESKLATSRQDQFVADGKVWRRTMATRAQRAARLGATIPKELLVIGRADTVPKLLESMSTMLRFAKEVAPVLSSAGDIKPLIEEGQHIYDALAEADAEQENKRFNELPVKARELFRSKGELYIALKVVNDAGKERYMRDPQMAARYNLSILHRRGSRPGEPEDGAEVPPPEAS